MKSLVRKTDPFIFPLVPADEKPAEQGGGIIKSIAPSGDDFVIKDEPASEMMQLTGEYPTDELPGVLLKGIQYYDLQSIGFINNTGMAKLIGLLRSLLKKGVEVRFVNVSEQIRSKIRKMGLDHILPCS